MIYKPKTYNAATRLLHILTWFNVKHAVFKRKYHSQFRTVQKFHLCEVFNKQLKKVLLLSLGLADDPFWCKLLCFITYFS